MPLERQFLTISTINNPSLLRFVNLFIAELLYEIVFYLATFDNVIKILIRWLRDTISGRDPILDCMIPTKL